MKENKKIKDNFLLELFVVLLYTTFATHLIKQKNSYYISPLCHISSIIIILKHECTMVDHWGGAKVHVLSKLYIPAWNIIGRYCFACIYQHIAVVRVLVMVWWWSWRLDVPFNIRKD